MALAETSQAWIKDLAADGALTEQDVKLLEETLGKNDAVAKRLEGSVLRQNEFDRYFNERKKEFEEKERQTLGLQDELVTWKKEADRQIEEAKKRAADEKAQRERFSSQIKAKAQELGIDLSEFNLSPDDGPEPKPGNQQTALDTSKFVTQEQFDEILWKSMMVPSEVQDMAVEHQALFGKPLVKTAQLLEKARKERKPIREVWEAEYQVAERRKVIEEEQTKQREAQIRAEEREKVMSELNLPTRGTKPEIVSPILSQFASSSGKKESLTGAEAAAAAWKEGKYSPEAASSE